MHCCSTHSALCRCRNLHTVLYYTIMRTVPNGSLMEIYCITYRLLLFILYVILLVDILYITEPQSVEVFILTNVSAVFIENKYNSHYRSTILLEFLGECRLRCDLRKVNKCTQGCVSSDLILRPFSWSIPLLHSITGKLFPGPAVTAFLPHVF